MEIRQELTEELRSGEVTLIAERNGNCYRSCDTGVKPIVTPMKNNRGFFSGASVADKVIGKAAALLLILSGAEYVYGETMSEAAAAVLEENSVAYAFGQKVRYIKNREGNDMCPLEKCVAETKNPAEAWTLIENKIAQLMREKEGKIS